MSTQTAATETETISVPSRFLIEVCEALPGHVVRATWEPAPEPVVDHAGTSAAPTRSIWPCRSSRSRPACSS